MRGRCGVRRSIGAAGALKLAPGGHGDCGVSEIVVFDSSVRDPGAFARCCDLYADASDVRACCRASARARVSCGLMSKARRNARVKSEALLKPSPYAISVTGICGKR